MESKRKGLEINVLLLTLAIIVIALIYILGAYKSYSCSKICISGLSQGNNYEITAKISYSGEKLPNTVLNALINSKYGSLISTNPESILTFKAPLNLGPNLINFRYGNSNTSAYFFYTGGMIYMLLIPLSIILLILLMRLSSTISQRNKIILYSDDNPCLPSRSILYESATFATKKGIRIVNGLPELVTDIVDEYAKSERATGQKAIRKDPLYISKKIEAHKPGTTMLNCVNDNSICKETAVARILYESAVTSNSDKLLIGKTPDGMLSINNVKFLDGISIPVIAKMSKKADKILVFLSDYGEADRFCHLIKHFSPTGSALLLLQTEGIIQPILYGV